MRFLFVYYDRAREARDLLARLQVEGVELIVVGKGEDAPSAEVLNRFRGSQAAAAACQINRKYRRTLNAHVRLEYEPNEFRVEDRQLEAWLCPPPREEEFFPPPSESFLSAARECATLILAEGALDDADKLVEFRRKFVAKSARLLASFALGEAVGPPRDWKSAHGVEFAPNGKVRRKYKPRGIQGFVDRVSEWHLKEGDKTSAESAARIYFDRVTVGDRSFVVVGYVGPHPPDGTAEIFFDIPIQESETG